MYPPINVRQHSDGSMIYYWDWDTGTETDRSGACSIFIGRSQFGVNTYGASDTIWCEPFSFKLLLPTEYSTTTYFRIALREVDSGNSIGGRVGSSDWINISLSNAPSNDFGSSFDVTIPRTYIRIYNGGNYEGLSVHLEFQCASMDNAMGIGSNQSNLTIFYGVGSSPNYPTFTPPDTAIVNEVKALDDQVLNNSVVSSLEVNTEDLFSNIGSSLPMFVDGIKFASERLNMFFNTPNNNLLWFRHFIQISLALGIAASLLGIAASIIGAATRGGGKKGG